MAEKEAEKKPEIRYMNRLNFDKWRLSRKEANEETIIPPEVLSEINKADPFDLMKVGITFNSPMTVVSADVITDLETFKKIIGR